MPEDVYWTGGVGLVGGAGWGWTPENANCRAGGPVCDVAYLDHLLRVVLLQVQRYAEVELVAPAIGSRLQGQRVPDGRGCCIRGQRYVARDVAGCDAHDSGF